MRFRDPFCMPRVGKKKEGSQQFIPNEVIWAPLADVLFHLSGPFLVYWTPLGSRWRPGLLKLPKRHQHYLQNGPRDTQNCAKTKTHCLVTPNNTAKKCDTGPLFRTFPKQCFRRQSSGSQQKHDNKNAMVAPSPLIFRLRCV